MNRKIAILGSTGSIGVNTLRVIEGLGSGFEVFAITAHNSVQLLAEQAKQFKPAYVGITNPERERATSAKHLEILTAKFLSDRKRWSRSPNWPKLIRW